MEQQTPTLSEREKEILQLVATGVTNQQVARALQISPNTVKVHLRNIFGKLGVESRTEAVLLAVQEGWVELPGLEAVEPRPEPLPAPAARPAIGPYRRAFLVVSVLAVLAALWLPWPNAGPAEAGQGDFAEAAAGERAVGPYQAGASRWLPRVQMPTPRGRLAVAAVESAVYAIGGATDQGITGRVEVYDTAADAWNTAEPLPTPAANISAAVIDGRIYVPGGYGADGSFLQTLQVYDPAVGAWGEAAPLPLPLAGYALATDGAQLYLFGGSDGQEYRSDAYRYDPQADRWQTLPPMPTARGFAAAGWLQGWAYVVGGYDGQRELATCERFDPAAGGWLPCAALTAARGGLAAAVVGEALYAMGGGWDSHLAFNEKYTPAADSWASFETPILGEWRLLGAAAQGPYIYALGGRSGRYLSANEAYQAQFRILLPVGP
ncbi:MAG: hypothetical protein GX605_02265 [Chloroflexi bacterium]|nr:hypothetical protein [Chloroflexota bacterium]